MQISVFSIKILKKNVSGLLPQTHCNPSSLLAALPVSKCVALQAMFEGSTLKLTYCGCSFTDTTSRHA